MNELEAVIVELVKRALREELPAALAELRATSEPAALLTVGQAAARVGMSTSYIRAAISAGRLPARRIGRAVRLAASDVDAIPEHRSIAQSSDSPRDRASRIRIGGGR